MSLCTYNALIIYALSLYALIKCTMVSNKQILVNNSIKFTIHGTIKAITLHSATVQYARLDALGRTCEVK